MLKLLVRRTAEAVPLVFGVATLTFFLSRLAPGDVSSAFISPRMPPDVAESIQHQFGLDRPVAEQYLLWLRSVLQGDLGYSFTHSTSVTGVLKEAFPNTALLGVTALMIEILLAIALVALAVARPGSQLDRFISSGTLVVYTIPTFWIGVVLVSLFAYGLGFLPSSHMHSLGAAERGVTGSVIDLARHLVLPALTIAIPGGAGLARFLRTHVTTTMDQEYVIAAKSMGLSRRKVFLSYVLPNSVGPMVSLLGIEFGVLLSGVVVTETLFAWPGMGRVAVMSIFARDYPLVLGCTIVASAIVVLGNVVADVVNSAIDPRIRLGS